MGSAAAFDDALPRSRFRNWVILGACALIALALLLGAMFATAVQATDQRREAERWHLHTLEVLLTIESLKASAGQAAHGSDDFLITGDAAFLRPFDAASDEAGQRIARLEWQTRDNPRQRANIAALKPEFARLLGELRAEIALVRADRGDEAVRRVRSGEAGAALVPVLATLDRLQGEEQRLLDQRARANIAAEQAMMQIGGWLALSGLAMLAITAVAGISTMRAQRRVREAAERLHRSAVTDELTGLANRRWFLKALDTEVARAERSGSPLSVAVLDLDRFKAINDRHGHAGGDAVLRGFAEIASAAMRAGDLVARLGGEEFAVLMPDTDPGQAAHACERLRAAIAEAQFRDPEGTPISATVSGGIALLVPGEARDRLVTRADAALYRAKEEGRNQLRMAA